MTLRVAIIEDSADLLDELLAFLRFRGFDAWGVHSAEAFWRQLHRDPVDIVLVDIGLPGEDGFILGTEAGKPGGAVRHSAAADPAGASDDGALNAQSRRGLSQGRSARVSFPR